jgi:hypothetical protein
MKTLALVFCGLLSRFWRQANEDTGSCFLWIIEQVLINNSLLTCVTESSFPCARLISLGLNSHKIRSNFIEQK